MSVTVRPYRGGGWEIDIRLDLPDGAPVRERLKSPVTGKTGSQRWGESRERFLFANGRPVKPAKEVITTTVATLREFAPRFLTGYAEANRQKPSGIAGKESILRVHLIPRFGSTPISMITTEDIQRLKADLKAKAPKTVNNVLTVLHTALRQAVAWGLIDRMPCVITMLPTPVPPVPFHDVDAFERLVRQAQVEGATIHALVLLGGDAGLRCGELMALEWRDVDFDKRQITVARSGWRGHVTLPKGGKLRHVPMTTRLDVALRQVRHLKAPRVLVSGAAESLTQKVVQGLVARTARKAGVLPGVHILRHTFCSHLAMRGAPARAIQELAGHKDLATTQRYMHLSPAAVEAAIALLDRPEAGESLETFWRRRESKN